MLSYFQADLSVEYYGEYVVGKKAEDQEAKGHPAPFPCALARDHILSWTEEQDLVLDPMCGSGTTCRSARYIRMLWMSKKKKRILIVLFEPPLIPTRNSGLWAQSEYANTE